jgi:uncharacterized membrane protein YfcA
MPWILHWKATVAMTAVYVACALTAIVFIKDALTLTTILLLAFFVILLAGNMFVKRR